LNTRSIRFRLTAWYAGLLTLVYVLFAALLMLRLQSYLQANVLETQARRARQIATTLIARIEPAAEAAVVEEIKALYSPELSDRFIRITRADGSVLYRSGEPSDHSFNSEDVPPVVAPILQDLRRKQRLPDGRTILIAAVDVGGAAHNTYTVEVGVSTASILALLHQLLWLIALGLPVTVVVAVSGGSLLVKRTLAPVERIASKAELITHHNLAERLPVVRTGDELERLAISLNHMITRLDDAFQQSKRFVADASHELRTPLTVLRSELESLAQNPFGALDPYERLSSLLQPVERLSKTIERLFALSRLDAGEAQTEWVGIDLGELVATTADQMLLLAADKGITVTCEARERVMVTGDRSRLKQVIVNLLDNAIKYTPVDGAVRLRVDAVEGRAVLTVADSGIGLPAEAVPHVFERFYRVDATRSDDTGGAGLGLAIVKTICDAHGAMVRVVSELGRGSSFHVTFPR
jgi:heavy metal sensor kinase